MGLDDSRVILEGATVVPVLKVKKRVFFIGIAVELILDPPIVHISS